MPTSLTDGAVEEDAGTAAGGAGGAGAGAGTGSSTGSGGLESSSGAGKTMVTSAALLLTVAFVAFVGL